MAKELNTGHYLEQTLTKKKIKKEDIDSLISFALKVPVKDYDKDFAMSSEVRFALNGIKEAYTVLSRKYEPSLEYVLFNSLLQEDIINSLNKLAGKRKNQKDLKAIEALKENMIIERLRMKVDDDIKLSEGSLIGKIKAFLQKKQMF